MNNNEIFYKYHAFCLTINFELFLSIFRDFLGPVPNSNNQVVELQYSVSAAGEIAEQ